MADLLSQGLLDDLNQGATEEKLNMGKKPMGFLDHVMFALTGTPDQLLTPEDARARSGRKKEASQMATSAAENPGEQYMGIPTAGGSGADMGDLIKLGMKLFAAG
jgi:hypothetical protein